MSDANAQVHHSKYFSPMKNITFFLIATVLIFAPIFRGANRPIPLLILELLSLLLITSGLFVWKRENLSKTHLAFLIAILCVPLLYLIPIPFSLWQQLPGRELYANLLQIIDAKDSFHTLSIYSRATLTSWLALLVPIIVFLHIVNLSKSQVTNLVYLVLGIAVLQSLVGLIQYAQGPESLLRFGATGHPFSAIGSYANRNHLAGFLEMIFPLALMSVYAITIESISRRSSHLTLTKVFTPQFVLSTAILIVILLGIVFTRSRMGIALTMFGFLLTSFVAARQINYSRVHRITMLVSVVIILLAAELGLAPVFERFAQQDPLSDSRWEIFHATWNGIEQFFPIGAGPGNFSFVFPRFQPENISRYVNFAHNDYLEWIFELGLFAVALIVLSAYFLINRGIELLGKKEKKQPNNLQIAAGIGIILLLLHGLMDFNFHIPANAIFFAFLCGIFFHNNLDYENRINRNAIE